METINKLRYYINNDATNKELKNITFDLIGETFNLNDNKKSIACKIVLSLMDSIKYSNNYCKALRIALLLCPNVDKAKLEEELNLYV